MESGSKIFIIDDERNGISLFSQALCSCLPSTEQERMDRNKKWDGIPEEMPKTPGASDEAKREYYFNQFNAFWAGYAICPRSFADAYRLVEAVGTGEDYEWIFIDRDLGQYHDIGKEITIGKKTFTPDFFAAFDRFAGDFLFITLVNAGVPIEKICFLTANSTDSIEAVEKSPYLHKNRLPRIIAKTTAQEDLKKILTDSHKAKIRFLYRDIFNNQKVNAIWGPYLELFIALLARRYSGKAYKPSQGIILRLMIEVGIPQTIPQRYADLSTRQFLNYKDVQYNISLKVDVDYQNASQEDKDLHNAWKEIVKRVGENLLWAKPQDVQKEITLYNQRKKTSITPGKLINYDTARFLTALSSLYFSPPPTGLPPKYIFSYIDNIYTVTSEFSAHGKNNTTTNDLSPDGWSALLSGMLQIMQWVAKENPNPPSQS